MTSSSMSTVAGGPRMTTALSSGEACTVTPSRVKPSGRTAGPDSGSAVEAPAPEVRALAAMAAVSRLEALRLASPVLPRSDRATGLVADGSPPRRPRTISVIDSASEFLRRTTRVTGVAPPGVSSAATIDRAWARSAASPRISRTLERSSAVTRGPPASEPSRALTEAATSVAEAWRRAMLSNEVPPP